MSPSTGDDGRDERDVEDVLGNPTQCTEYGVDVWVGRGRGRGTQRGSVPWDGT